MRRAYAAALAQVVRRPLDPPRAVPCVVFAFSGEQDLPEQVAGARSFLRHVGRPRAYTVVSDGSHRPRSRALLRAIDPALAVVDLAELVRADLPPRVRDYMAREAMGKKLALELSLPVDGPTLYADADVLFFPAAARLAALLEGDDAPARFLADPEPYLDERLAAPDGEPPVNGGLFVLRQPPAWEAALERLAALPAGYRFHTEQTLLQLALRATGARALEPAAYVVATDDMRAYRDRHAGPRTVLRHYTTPVRHKLWCRVGRQGAAATAAR